MENFESLTDGINSLLRNGKNAFQTCSTDTQNHVLDRLEERASTTGKQKKTLY